MAWIELITDLKRTNALLERIARVGERLLLEQYGVQLGHTTEPAPDPQPSEKATVTYATDETLVRQKLEILAKGVEEGDVEAWMEE